MPDLLLEVLSEEIPARMQAGGVDQLKKQVLSRLEEARLEFATEDVKSYATPRRLALIVSGLPDVQPDITVERKGPRVDAPEKAIQGFLKSTGLSLDDCEQRETPKGPVWFAVTQEKGRPTSDLLADLLPQALAAVSWPKSMRWDGSGVRWVRPIRSILCLLDDEVVPFHFGTVESGRTTLGHRFLKPGPHTIEQVRDYATTLEAAKVMLDATRRTQKIEMDAKARAEGEGLRFAWDGWLISENSGLAEWPVVLMGTVDSHFMTEVPEEVLRSAMSTHQRYFSLLDMGFPAPRFVTVADGATDDSNHAVIAGNERVLRARLADARFFWDQDRRQTLAARAPELQGVNFQPQPGSTTDQVPQLEGVVFHARLGSMAEKALRIAKLARDLCPSIPGADPDLAARAGLLCKADLVTEMVGEFPDLQGVMGGYYARADGENEAVYNAIHEQYSPRGPDDACPTAPVSIAVALADKLDTLAGFFAIDERPTGSKDPFALRRAALGVIRLIVESELRLSLDRSFDDALAGYGALLPKEPGLEATRDALRAFFDDRFKVHLRKEGYRHDLIGAVFGMEGGEDLVQSRDRVLELWNFLESEDGANLLTAYRRAANILRIEEKNDGVPYMGQADPELFDQDEERTLHERIGEANKQAENALGQEEFWKAMSAMAPLRAPVDAFFDHVTVNCDDPELRRNRLLMLSQIRATLDRVADFSKIEG